VLHRRLQELEEETTALKRWLFTANPAASSIPLPDGDAPLHQEEDIDISQIPTATILRRNERSSDIDIDPTLSRTIDGLELAPDIINDCFEL
jgi:hypothetical protein